MTGYDATETGLSFLLKTIRQFEYPQVFLAVALLGFAMSLFFGKRKGRLIFVYPSILIALVLLNPYIFPELLAGRVGLNTEYYRTLWMLPTAMVTGYGAVSLMRVFKPRAAGILALSIFAVGIVITGTSQINDLSWMNGPSNIWGAETEVIRITGQILNDSDSDRPLVYFPTEELAEEVRGIEPTIRGVIAPSYEEIEADYYVLEAGTDVTEETEEEKLTVVYESEDYVVYK